MKELLLLLFLLSAICVSAQKVIITKRVTDHSVHVIGDNFEGIVFIGDDFADVAAKDSSEGSKIKVYTPSRADLNIAEDILYSQIKDIDKDHHYRNGLDIFNNWKRYRHQYIFYKTQDGEKYVWINNFSVLDDNVRSLKTSFISEQLKVPRWYNDLIFAFDGCDAYWRARIDLHKKKIIEFNINGSPIGSSQ